jgi:drug/metabolite transporter (DMT)-like permease
VLDTTGVLLAFVAAVGWGSYILLTKRVGQTWPGLEGLAIAMAISALVSLPFGLTHFADRYAELDKDLFGPRASYAWKYGISDPRYGICCRPAQ